VDQYSWGKFDRFIFQPDINVGLQGVDIWAQRLTYGILKHIKVGYNNNVYPKASQPATLIWNINLTYITNTQQYMYLVTFKARQY